MILLDINNKAIYEALCLRFESVIQGYDFNLKKLKLYKIKCVFEKEKKFIFKFK